MESLETNISITFKGFIIGCIILIPHCIFSFFATIFRKYGKYDFSQTDNLLSSLLSTAVFAMYFLFLIGLGILISPVFALIDLFALSAIYSEYPFFEATKKAFIDVFEHLD